MSSGSTTLQGSIMGKPVGFASVQSCALLGLTPHTITVEVSCTRGPPLFQMVGLPEAPVREARVRVASALGKLGHKAALPLLKATAADDIDETVRTKAHEAVIAVAKANHIKEELPADQTVQARKKTTSGFGRSPHAVEGAPDLYVTVKGANDDSPGVTDKAARKQHAEILKASLQDSLRSAPQVTMVQTEAERWGLDARTIDVSVTKLEMSQSGGYIEVSAELRLAISDQSGKMLSFLSGGAKVQVPAKTYNAKYLPNLRKEALENAMRGMFAKLLNHLRTNAQS